MTKFKLTPIKLKGKFADPKAYARAVENTLNASALSAKADFGTTTQTWEHKPKFSIESKPGERVVGTDDQIFQWVDEGTPAHIIQAKGGGRLRYRNGYRAKTSPGFIGSRSGGASGAWRGPRRVRHPGTKARDFTGEIQKKWDKELPVTMQRAINAEKE